MSTLYEKVGRRYKPVSDMQGYDGLCNGCWLVVVKDGCRSTLRIVDPALVEVEAAMRLCTDEMVKALSDASKYQPTRQLTKAELKAWQEFQRVCGGKMMIQQESMYGIVEAGLKRLRELMAKGAAA